MNRSISERLQEHAIQIGAEMEWTPEECEECGTFEAAKAQFDEEWAESQE